jgi:hypothetical protein
MRRERAWLAVRATTGAAMVVLLLGCQKERVWTLRLHDPGKLVSGSMLLGKARTDAQVTTTCDGPHGPMPTFAPSRDGSSLVAKTFYDLESTCRFTVAVPGGPTSSYAVGDLCTRPVGTRTCDGVDATLVLPAAKP